VAELRAFTVPNCRRLGVGACAVSFDSPEPHQNQNDEAPYYRTYCYHKALP
jgi:hypothetical protein